MKECTAPNTGLVLLLAFLYIWCADFQISICLADKYFSVNPQRTKPPVGGHCGRNVAQNTASSGKLPCIKEYQIFFDRFFTSVGMLRIIHNLSGV